MSHCVITGSALATAQGADADCTWRNLLAGAVLHETGRVPLAIDVSLPRVSQLAIHVAQDAIAAAKWPADSIGDDRTALIIGTSKGPIEAWLAGGPTSVFGISTVAADVARAIGHGYGPRLTMSAACASGLHALIRGKALLDAGVCDRAIVVAAESSISPLFEAAFSRMGILARPAVGCRPFDVDREGFLLAEAAAAVCIERSGRGVTVEATSLRSDPTHLTGLDPAGEPMAAALRAVAGEHAIDLVHAHGTGTPLNDPIELAAIARSCGGAVVVSHKHAIGHTQGAAGLISVVLNVMAHRHEKIFPNANTAGPLPIKGIAILREWTAPKLRSSVVLAAGFGGPVGAVRLAY